MLNFLSCRAGCSRMLDSPSGCVGCLDSSDCTAELGQQNGGAGGAPRAATVTEATRATPGIGPLLAERSRRS